MENITTVFSFIIVFFFFVFVCMEEIGVFGFCHHYTFYLNRGSDVL